MWVLFASTAPILPYWDSCQHKLISWKSDSTCIVFDLLLIHRWQVTQEHRTPHVPWSFNPFILILFRVIRSLDLRRQFDCVYLFNTYSGDTTVVTDTDLGHPRPHSYMSHTTQETETKQKPEQGGISKTILSSSWSYDKFMNILIDQSETIQS